MKLLSRSCQTVQIMKNRPQKSLAGVRTASTNFRSRQLTELIIVTISCQLESVCFFVAVKIDRGAVDHSNQQPSPCLYLWIQEGRQKHFNWYRTRKADSAIVGKWGVPSNHDASESIGNACKRSQSKSRTTKEQEEAKVPSACSAQCSKFSFRITRKTNREKHLRRSWSTPFRRGKKWCC